MRRLIRLIAAATLAAMAACGGGPETEPEPFKPPQEPAPQPAVDYGKLDLLAGLEQRTLDNGLKVFAKQDRRLGIVTVAVVYRVGSVHEPDDTSGLAHFLEHMLFKGTKKYAKGDIDRITVRAGGSNNAFSEDDFTLYWFSVAADALDDALQIQASLMNDATLDRKEFDGERDVMIDELYELLDSPSGMLRYEMDPAVFKTHSYRRPGWGTENDLKTVSHEVLRDFYRNYYGPNNAAIVIVGDIDCGRTFSRVRELFGGMPRVGEAVPAVPSEPPQKEAKRVEIVSEKSLDRLGLAWRSGVTGSEEDFVLDVARNLLAHGKDSRLYKRLVLRDRSVSSLDVDNDARRYDGLFSVFCEVAKEAEPKDVEAAVLEELDLLKTKPVTARELQKAKNLITAEFIFGKESARDLAEGIGTFEGLGVPNYLRDYLARVNAVTPEAVQKVAAAVFRPENRTAVLARSKKRRTARMSPAQAPAELGEFKEHRLANGLTLLVKPRREMPIVSIKAFVNAGPLTETPDKAGIATLTGRLLDQGFSAPDGRTMSAEQIAEAIEYTGTQLSTSAEGLEIKTLARDTETMLDFLRDMLLHPSFPREKVDLWRDLQLRSLRARADSPRDAASDLWFREVYGGYPLERPTEGLAGTVEKLTRADALAHYRAFYRPDNSIIAVVGDVDADGIVRELDRRFSEWRSEGPAVLPAVAKPRRQDKPRIAVEYRKTEEVQVCLGHLSIPYDHPDYIALRVFEQIYCNSTAFTDRLSLVVREDLHLAYDVSGTVTDLGPYPAPFLVCFGSSADKGTQAREAAVRILRELLKDGPTDEEMETAKRYLTRSMPFLWERAEDVARYLVTLRRLGLKADWAARCRDAFAAVTKADVLRAAREHLSADALTVTVVGPVDKDGKVIEDEEK